MKEITARILKIVALILGIALIVSSIFIIRSCSPPPDYSEIKDRVEELINNSHDVNEIVWGKGLPTYERVFDPKASLDIYKTQETYIDANGKEQPLNYHFYYTLCKEHIVVAYRRQNDYKAEYLYAYVADKALDEASLASLFPLAEGETATEGLYKEVYSDAKGGKYAYLVPFTEPEYSFYYRESDLPNYDYVAADSGYTSIDDIKTYIQTVYSENYATSLYEPLFDGVSAGSLTSQPRYSISSGINSSSLLLSLNTYEPLFTEKRVYLFDTAKIDTNVSDQNTVVVKFSTYLPSEPDNIVTTSLTFVLQGGSWYLASPTY